MEQTKRLFASFWRSSPWTLLSLTESLQELSIRVEYGLNRKGGMRLSF